VPAPSRRAPHAPPPQCDLSTIAHAAAASEHVINCLCSHAAPPPRGAAGGAPGQPWALVGPLAAAPLVSLSLLRELGIFPQGDKMYYHVGGDGIELLPMQGSAALITQGLLGKALPGPEAALFHAALLGALPGSSGCGGGGRAAGGGDAVNGGGSGGGAGISSGGGGGGAREWEAAKRVYGDGDARLAATVASAQLVGSCLLQRAQAAAAAQPRPREAVARLDHVRRRACWRASCAARLPAGGGGAAVACPTCAAAVYCSEACARLDGEHMWECPVLQHAALSGGGAAANLAGRHAPHRVLERVLLAAGPLRGSQ
jgi:hypothetical protein